MTHPDLDTLILYADGLLPAGRRKAIEAHVSACGVCELELHGLKSALDVSHDGAAAGPGEAAAGLDGIMARIERWEARRSGPEHAGAAVKLEVAREIAPYLGGRAAGEILEPVADEGQDLLSTVEPVLGLFLGRKAASSLVSRIVETAIMRI